MSTGGSTTSWTRATGTSSGTGRGRTRSPARSTTWRRTPCEEAVTTPPPAPPPPASPPPPPMPSVPSGGWSPVPAASPVERIRAAYAARSQSDYYFSNVGLDIFLTIITFDIYGFVVFYQLM